MKLSREEKKTMMESLELNIETLREYELNHSDMPNVVLKALHEKIDQFNFLHTKVRDADAINLS